MTRLYQSIRGIECEGVGIVDDVVDAFTAAMNDDFNTPIALSVLFQLSHELNKTKSPQLAATLKHLASILGLLQADAESFLQGGQFDADEITQLVNERFEARIQRNWTKADALRQQLKDMGIEVEDTAEGSIWRVIS